MYEELCKAWKTENESQELLTLPSDFYSRLASYFKKLKEENRMLEKRSLKALLLSEEKKRAEIMVTALVKTRFGKINALIAARGEIPAENLTSEEREIAQNLSASDVQCLSFVKALFQGNAGTNRDDKGILMVAVRFLKSVPEIIGTDMNKYGPFQAEDISSLPPKNAAVLIDKKLATRINVK